MHGFVCIERGYRHPKKQSGALLFPLISSAGKQTDKAAVVCELPRAGVGKFFGQARACQRHDALGIGLFSIGPRAGAWLSEPDQPSSSLFPLSSRQPLYLAWFGSLQRHVREKRANMVHYYRSLLHRQQGEDICHASNHIFGNIIGFQLWMKVIILHSRSSCFFLSIKHFLPIAVY
jgi:hypothetical protein